MTMITPTTIPTILAILYGLLTVITGWVVWNTNRDASDDEEYLLKYRWAAVAVLAVTSIEMALAATGIAVAAVGSKLDLVSTITDVVVYAILYGTVASLATTSKRKVVILVGTILLMRISFTISSVTGGILAAVSGLIIIFGFIFVLYLFFRPLKRDSMDRKRLIKAAHVKTRNILALSFSGLIVFALLFLSGLISDPVIGQAVVQYNNLFFKAGVSIYIIYALGEVIQSEAKQ